MVLQLLTGSDAKTAIAALGALDDPATAFLRSPPDLDDDETVERQIIASARHHGLDEPPAVVDYLLDALDAERLLPRVPRPMSRGERQICGLLLVFSRPFDQLVLDDPTAGLDPVRRRTVVDLLADLAADGTEILCASADPLFGAAQ